jgi:DNA-binding CsgD family transcriptional regulator
VRRSTFTQSAWTMATRMQTGLSMAFAHRARALVAHERGDMTSMVEEAAASGQAADRAGAPIESGRSEIIHGRGLAALGDRAGAGRILRSAHERLQTCGALRYSNQAEKELRGLGWAVPRSRGRDGNYNGLGLSAREREVIELVASGRTNREIGELLLISAPTVDRHVARIFDKLGVKSRAAASALFERANIDSPSTHEEPSD